MHLNMPNCPSVLLNLLLHDDLSVCLLYATFVLFVL